MLQNLFKKPQTIGEAVEGKVIYVLGLVVITQTIYPISENSIIGTIIDQFLYLLLVFSGVILARQSPKTSLVLAVLGVFWMVMGVLYALNQSNIIAQMMAYISFGIYQAVIAGVLLQYIFHTKKVSRDVLYAAVTVYFLLGAIFVPVFGIIETITFMQTGNHAFTDSFVSAGQPVPWQSFIYYSYVSLTTMGYGDILPVTMWARSAASLEAIIGVMYTAIIVSRLVALYITHNDDAGAAPVP